MLVCLEDPGLKEIVQEKIETLYQSYHWLPALNVPIYTLVSSTSSSFNALAIARQASHFGNVPFRALLITGCEMPALLAN